MADLRLVCCGFRAQARSSLQQQCFQSLIEELTEEAVLHSKSVPGLEDGAHSLVFEGRGRHRDVYRVGETLVLKLIKPEIESKELSMKQESDVLKNTARLPQTPSLHYRGSVHIYANKVDSKPSDSVTLTVEGLLMSYEGPSYDKLLHEWCARPFNLVAANFFVSAIIDLISMFFDGQDFGIGYSDMHTANICTLSDPAKHVSGQNVPSVICDAEGVSGRKWCRSVFDSVCQEMISDFELHFANARHESWRFLGDRMSVYTRDFFKQNTNEPLDAVRSRFLERLRLMWRNSCNTYAQIIGASSQRYAEASASVAVSSSATAQCPRVQSAIRMAPWNKHFAAATISLPPLPVPMVGMLLCGHTADAIDYACEVCKKYLVQKGSVEDPAIAGGVAQTKSDPSIGVACLPLAIASQSSAPLKSRPSTGFARLACGHRTNEDCQCCRVNAETVSETIQAGSEPSVPSQRYAPLSSLMEESDEQFVVDWDPDDVKRSSIKRTLHSFEPESKSSSVKRSSSFAAPEAQRSGVKRPSSFAAPEAKRSGVKRPSHFSASEAKRSSPFDAVERKRTSPFDARESSRLVLHRAQQGVAIEDYSMTQWKLFVSPQEAFEQRYADPIAEAARRELESQRSSTFRGGGRFQEDRPGRMSWEDRKAAGVFEREPQMTQAESDDVNRLCKIMYLTLHDVLDRIPLTNKCKQQRRVEKESEFKKYGMAKRVFNYLKGYTYSQDHWCNPKALFEIVLEEFDRLSGSEGPKLAIPNFQFLDDHEREFLARVATRGFMAGGLQHGQDLNLRHR